MTNKNILEGTAYDSLQPSRLDAVSSDALHPQEEPFVFSNNGEVIDNTFTSNSTTETNSVEQLTNTQLFHSTATTTAEEENSGSYITRFSNNKCVRGTRATYESFMADTTNPAVAQICKQLRELDTNSDGYAAAKRALKEQLPLYTYCGYNAEDNRSAAMQSNGNVIIDIDGIDSEDELQEIVDKVLGWHEDTDGERLLLLHRTPSYRGLRVVFVGDEDLTMVENQVEFFTQLEIPLSYRDKGAHDIKRMSYIVPKDYIFYVSEKLFGGKNIPLLTDVSSATNVVASDSSAASVDYSAIEWTDNITVDSQLIDNYYNKHGYKRVENKRHNVDREFGKHLNYLGVQATEVKAYYDAYIAKFKSEGYYFSDDPSETSEGINAVMWGYSHPSATASVAVNAGDTSIKVPFYDCTFEELMENFQDPLFQLGELEKIVFPKAIEATLKPLDNEDAMRQYITAAVYSMLTVGSTYLQNLEYADDEDSDSEKIALMTFVTATTGDGKKELAKIWSLWADELAELKLQMQQRWDRWVAEKEALLAEDPKAEIPDEPFNGVLLLKNTNITARGIFDAFELNQGYRFAVLCNELDNITESKGQHFGITSTHIRNIYDSENVSIVRANDPVQKRGRYDTPGILEAPACVNIMATGTPDDIDDLFSADDVKNGTSSRVNIIEIEKVQNQPYRKGYPVKRIKNLNLIQPLCRSLLKNSGVIVVPELEQLKKEWFNAWIKYDEQKGFRYTSIDIMKNRAQDMAYRYALTLYMMEVNSNGYLYQDNVWYKKGEQCNQPKVSDSVKNMFIYSANFVLTTQVRKYGHIHERSKQRTTTYDEVRDRFEQKDNTKLAQLADVFTRQEFNKLYATIKAAKSNLSKFVNGDKDRNKPPRIKKIGKDLYQKIR